LHAFIVSFRKKHKGPLGFYAFSDSFALAVINAATHLGLSVPGDLYVLGTANEPIVCTMCPIPISSVPHQSRQLGFTAAKILHALMRGEAVPKRTLIEPDAVIERRSSSHLAVSDPLIEKALRIMQEQAVQGMNIKELLAFLPICRRAFEVRFRQTVGYSPHEELERIRLGKALSLLAGNAGTNSQIAAASGFSSSIYMERLIRNRTGKRPRDLRPPVG
jgi:LacI family transcriptional regulator